MVIKINFKPVIVFFAQKAFFTVSGSFFNYIPALADRTGIAGFFLKYLPLLHPFVRI